MSEENVEVLRKVYASWEQGDLSSTVDFDPQVEFIRIGAELSGIGLAGEWHGRDEVSIAIRDWMRAWEDLRIEAEDFRDLGDRVLVLDRHVGVGSAAACR